MYNRREGVICTLRHLIQACRNCERAFSTAQAAVTDGALRELLGAYAIQRTHFAAELESELKHFDVESGFASDSRPQALRRSWLRIRSAVGSDDEEGLLAEFEQGEGATLETYREALATHLPEYLYALVRRQYLEVQAARDRLRSLERRLAGGTNARKVKEYEGGSSAERRTLIPRFSLSSEAVGNYLR